MTSPKITISQKAAKSVENVESKLRSSPVFVSLIIFTFVLYCAMLVLQFLATKPAYSAGLFDIGMTKIPSGYPLNFTLPEWAFYILIVIHLSQLTWIIYSLGLICRIISQEPAYLSPVILSPMFYIFFNFSLAFSIGWLFLWDQFLFLASIIFLACIALSLILCVIIVSSRVMSFRETMIDQGRHGEMKFLQIVVLNSIAMNITWTIITALNNLGIVLVYKWNRPSAAESTSIICLSILAFLTVVYIGLDSTIFERFTRYCLSPYAVVIWSLAASVSDNYNPGNVSSIISLFLIGAVSLAFFVKLGLTFYHSSGVRGQYRLMKTNRPDDCPF